MKDKDFLATDDHQISYNVTINTITRMFNDEIKHCYQDIDSNIAKHLEGFRDEFISLFHHAYKDVECGTK